MNEEKEYKLIDWKDQILETFDADDITNEWLESYSFSKSNHSYLNDDKENTLIKISHWLTVIKEAQTMKSIRLGNMKYGQKELPLYKIDHLITEINEIMTVGKYSEEQQVWLNGLYKWYLDNNKNLNKAYD